MDILQQFLKELHEDGYLVLKSRYGCSINDLANDTYFIKSETNNTWFCLFENADYCEPNHCVKRHFQNMMYDLSKIYFNVIQQRSRCVNELVSSCFVITGSGIYISSRKNWFTTKTPESGQEALELKTKNQQFTDALLISRPSHKHGNEMFLNITKSVTSMSGGTEIFLATIGVEIHLNAVKNILEIFEQEIILLDENMLIISGFKSDNGVSDGHPLKSFYPILAQKLQNAYIFSSFYYHECLHECRISIPPDPRCAEEYHPSSEFVHRYNYYCRNIPKTRSELCCKQFSTYSRNTSNYPIHTPDSLDVEYELNHTCLELCRDDNSCPENNCDMLNCDLGTQDCWVKLPGNCTKTYAIMDIPQTNILAIIDISFNCSRMPPKKIDEKDVMYNYSTCHHAQNDYYKAFKTCHPVSKEAERTSVKLKCASSTSHNKATITSNSLFYLLLDICMLVLQEKLFNWDL